jgi:hypothetical protein
MNCAAWHRQFRFEDIYFKEDRNLRKIIGKDGHHNEKRFKLLSQGYIDTVSLLNKFPQTEHEPASFKLDNCFFMVIKNVTADFLFYLQIKFRLFFVSQV